VEHFWGASSKIFSKISCQWQPDSQSSRSMM
jgi:hypothetical protein